MVEEDKLILKDSRWDKIARKHFQVPQSAKTEAVKRIEEIDFIDEKGYKVLKGEVPEKLDPALLIKLRHEMIKRPPKKESSSAESALARFKLEKIKEHNIAVEEHYISNELSKLRTQLQKQRINDKFKAPKVNLDPDMSEIKRSAGISATSVRDFFKAPIEAMDHIDSAVSMIETHLLPSLNESENLKMTVHFEDTFLDSCKSSIVSTEIEEIVQEETILEKSCETTDSITNSSSTSRTEVESKSNIRMSVHFEENVLDYVQETDRSHNDDDIDSAISYLADKVLDQIEAEAKLELVEEKFQQLKLSGTHINDDKEDFLTVSKITKEEIIEENQDSESSEECASSATESNSLIQKLFIRRYPPDRILLQKYFLKWIHYTTIQKIEKENISSNPNQISKINSFLDKIRHEKSRIAREKPISQCPENKMENVVMTKKYRNKIKLQQDIIDFQKVKLERQERLIMELKLHKLTDEAKEAKLEIKKELKAAMRSSDAKTRFKAKCLQLAGHLRDNEDDDLARLQGKSLLMPKFLIKMQERAKERSEKHEQVKQRRLAMEAEREAAKIAAEEAKRLEDEQAKIARIEALKEKRRQEKMAKLNKEKERQRMIENNQKASEFNRMRLLKSYGFNAFRKLIEIKRKNSRKCELLKRKIYKKRFFILWKDYCNKVRKEKNDKADRLYHRILKRNTLEMWFRYMNSEKNKYRVACDLYDLRLAERVLSNWSEYTRIQKLIEEAKMKQAEMHHEWHLKWKVVDRWQRLPQILILEKETEERRQRWRMKIWELLPDYTPVKDPFA